MAKTAERYEAVEMDGVPLSEEQRKRIKDRINSVLRYEPKIGVFGKSGVGKSSLCNALFGSDVCEIGDVAACTRKPQEVVLSMGHNGIKLLDVPGVGESQIRDEEYEALYASLLPELDLVLWVLKADDRALASEEAIFKKVVYPYVEKGLPFLFVVNQVDKIEPFRAWNDEQHEPGAAQLKNIQEKISVIRETFGVPNSKVIPVSAAEKYNLDILVEEAVFLLPKEKNIAFFSAVEEECRTEEAKSHVKKSFLEVVQEVICDVTDKFVDVVHTVADALPNVWNAAEIISNIFSWWRGW